MTLSRRFLLVQRNIEHAWKAIFRTSALDDHEAVDVEDDADRLHTYIALPGTEANC
jgi:hypothetical protein